ncbi:polysaccharide biosynthesis protein [Sulfolobus sp. S-194]|uniref:UDP-N-acetylglucosamine--N-acetylmuramyl- (pentapeptide) pyrophosphoryl-undecaprenol N-acetylglucosamine transferase n=1 Tax=Sulfolobus sp. S-194 TaxID=2512240 RepID=UPI001436DC05|nr:glycosyltransferase [Sulfolobus sp. S-194]QIW24028.1 polysaccharide biosynthesis protein [Sulfolobus sp. S-194]
MSELLIIASGGGHTGFGRAIAEYLPFKPDFVIPENDKNSEEMIKNLARKIYYVKKGKEPNEGNIQFLKNIFKILSQSGKIEKYRVVIATGSNHSIIPSFVQYLKRARIYGIESQDRIVTRGKAIRLISYFSKGIFLHWKEQKKLYPKKGIVVGPIVEKPKYKAENGDYILVTTGSQGFKELFNRLINLDLENVVVQTGKIDPNIYKDKKPNWKFFSFDPDIEKWIAKAKLIITHQGKTAMEAVVMYKKPSIIVYNKSWIYAATKEDSRLYAEILGATFLDDPSTWDSDEVLLKAIEKANKPKDYEIGTQKLVDLILSELTRK